MILLDTHAWIWWRGLPHLLSPAARRAIDAADRIGICTISCWEVAMLVAGNRLELDRDPRGWIAFSLAERRMEQVDVTAQIAVDAALLDRRSFPADPMDRLIYTAAQSRGAPLITKDAAIRGYDGEGTIW